MSKNELHKKDALDDLTYCEDANASMSRMDCLPAEDSHGAALRKSVLTGLAKTSCTVNPLEAWAATDAMHYNQRTPRKNYDWEAIAAKLGASSTQNDEKMAQTIATKQAELKPSIKDDKFDVDGKLGPKTISILDLQEETSGHINKQKADKKAETGTKEIAKTITDPQKEQLTKSVDPTVQQETKSNTSQNESQTTPILQDNTSLIKALETIGLEQEALQSEGANKAFRKIVSEFSGTGDQIAKLIVLAKVHKNPAFTYPIFTGLKYIGKSINIDKRDKNQKPEDRNTTNGICRNLCAHSVSVYNAVLSGSVPSTEDLQTDYNDLRKPNIGLVCNTVTEMMCRLALSNTIPGVKPDDESGTIDFVTSKSSSGYRHPNKDDETKLKATDLNQAKIGDVIVYYDKSIYENDGTFKFKHAAIIIDYIEDKNGVRSYAFMGASTLHDASGANVGGVAPRTTKGGTKDPNSPKGWGFIQTQEDLNNIYTDKIKLVYTSSEKFKNGSVKAGSPYVECVAFVWSTGSGKTAQHTQAQQESEHDDNTQFLASESNELKGKATIDTPSVEQSVTEPIKDITSLESQPLTTELKKVNDSQKTNDVKTTHKKDSSKPKSSKKKNKNFNPKKAVAWNEEHFKTKDDPRGIKTWTTLAQKLNVAITTPITHDQKIQIVEALQSEQSKWFRKAKDADGCYGIKSIKKLESNEKEFNINDVDFEKRQQNIENMLTSSNSSFKNGGEDRKYTHRHARYLTEFMNVSDKSDSNRGGEQIPFDLVRRMILDDLCNQQHENIGLLALWIGTAEWGVTNAPIKDPANKSWRGPDASGGKRSREYEQGGVGIADYDVGKLAKFYDEFLTSDSPDIASDCKKKLKADEKTATKYDDIKSYHAFYEIMSQLFDRDRGVEGDEWNDRASIWIMENWLDSTWDDAQARMKGDSKAAIFSRMQNSAHIPVDGDTKTHKTSYDSNIKFQKLDASSSVELMEKQYGDYGAVFHPKEGKTDEYARDNYISRLQTSKRVMVLQDYVASAYKAKEFTVSEDGAYVLDKAGNPVK